MFTDVCGSITEAEGLNDRLRILVEGDIHLFVLTFPGRVVRSGPSLYLRNASWHTAPQSQDNGYVGRHHLIRTDLSRVQTPCKVPKDIWYMLFLHVRDLRTILP